MDVAIVGCGTAGPALAGMLARRGRRVTIFEQHASPGPVGSGILLQPLGMGVLEEMGVGERVRAIASPVRRLHGVNRRGKTVLDLHYRDLHPGCVGYGVQRGLLFQALFDEARRQGVTIQTGIRVVAIDEPAGQRPGLLDAQGTRWGPFDLVVAADGARSALRAQSMASVGRVRRSVEYPWGAWWFTAPAGDPPQVTLPQDTLSQVYDDAAGMVGFLPSGRLESHGPQTISCFWSVRRRDEAEMRGRGIDWLKERICGLEPRAELLLRGLTNPGQVLSAAYQDVVMRPLWRGRTVFIGDAGHAMSPQLGLGANLALGDARLLAQRLDPLPSHPGADRVRAALREFSQARRPVLRYYSWTSRLLTPFFQSDERSLAVVRDLALPWMCRIGWTRREMLRAMTGAKSGLLT